MQNFTINGTGILRMSKWEFNGKVGFSPSLIIESKVHSIKGETIKTVRIPVVFKDDEAKETLLVNKNDTFDLIIKIPNTTLFVDNDKKDQLTALLDKYEIIGS